MKLQEDVIMWKKLRSGLAGLVISVCWLTSSVSAAELLMFREDGCSWCEKWDAEIRSIYPKTVEGKRAPLRDVDIHEPVAEFISDKGLVHFTPTFVLVDRGREIGRITGYPGEDNFWWLLEDLISKL